MKDFKKRGLSSFDVGHGPARVADTEPRQQPPDEKAAGAKALARDLESQAQLVRDDVAAIEIAAAAKDLADWTDAANDAAVGRSHLRDLVKKAPAAKLDATDARVRACLENAAEVLADTEALVDGAPAAPKLGAVVRCADALLAVLPADRPLGWEAERAVVEVVNNQANYADLVALREIVGERADHKLASRLKQFSKVARKKLMRILCDSEREERARARQEVQRQARRAAARAAAAAAAQAEARASAHAANVHPAPNPPVPGLRLDKTNDAERLHALVSMREQEGIVQLLEQNAHPEHMYALHRAYGSMLVADVQGALTKPSYLARARVYLGEQMSLDAKIGSRSKGDTDAILGDLERIPDARARALFEGDAITIAWTPRDPPAAPSEPEPAASWLPATTTLAAVKQALHGRLDADDYYRAMRLLLAKADRAVAAQNARAGANPPPGMNLDGFTFTLHDLTLDPSNPDVLSSPIALAPVPAARVDLTEARIREADAAGNWLADPMKARQAAVVLADLDRTERRAMAMRLRDKPLANALGGISLGMDALELDDATAIQTAILNVQTLANLKTQVAQGVGFEVALQRAGELVHAARAKLERIPPNAPEAERQKAQAELQRLESMFFGQGSPILEMLRVGASRAGDSDSGAAILESQLRALGADSVTVATEKLRAVPVGDAAALIAALRTVATENRLPAMQPSGQLDALSTGSTRLTPDQRELLSALLWQGAPPLQLGPLLTDPTSPPIILPPGLGPSLFGPRPELVIALHDILDAMGRGAAHDVLGRLARMSDEDQRVIYPDPRYRAKFDALPEGHERSSERHFKDSLRLAGTSGARSALLAYRGTHDGEQNVQLEAIGAEVDTDGQDGQANMRRAYVLVERLGGEQAIRKNPALLDTLAPEDRHAVERLIGGAGGFGFLGGLLGKRDDLIGDASDKETANQLIFGQPQLTDTAEAALDPTMEAAFMYYRLREAAGIRDGVELMDSFNSAGVELDESVTKFMVLYQQVRPGGVDRRELAQLADIYHRATRRLDTYRKATDSFASSAGQVVGAVVATVVVTIASGGTLGPIAVGAMAAVSGAAASAATGAAIRLDNTTMSVLRDAGTGAVEGIAAAAGAVLAARIVRGATMGVSAGRAAATAGAHAAGHATGGLGAAIAEAAIDGAIGGAAGELFQTATDEATWDRGIAEAFSAMLAAIARGAATGGLGGAAIGGVVGALGKLSRLAARLGEPTAHDVGRLLDAAGVGTQVLEHLSERSEDQLARVVALLRARQIDEAERALAAIEELPGHARARLASVARVRVMMETVADLGPIDLEGSLVLPRIIDDREFRKLAGARRGDAVVLIENGQPQIVMRQGASASALREELTHLAQWKTDPMMRQRMASLSEDRLASWKQVSSAKKLELHLDKLEVEADAQRRIIDQLAERASEDPEAATRVLDAEETLFELGQRIDTLQAVRGQPHLDAKALGINEAPRLFAKGAQTPAKVEGLRAAMARANIGKSIVDRGVQRKLRKLGYTVHGRQGTGTIFRLNRAPGTAERLPHLSVDEGTGLVIEARPGADFHERRLDAGREWRRSTEDLSKIDADLHAGALVGEAEVEARRVLANAGIHVRAALQKRIAAGVLDEASAGLIARWAKVIEELESRSAGSAVHVTMEDLLATLPRGPLSETQLASFRRLIRRRTVDHLMSIEDSARRTEKLYQMIDLQPDNGARGRLFSEYRQALMRSTADEGGPVFEVAGKKPQPFTGPDLKKARTPDDEVVIRAKIKDQLPGGKYTIEDKTGENAFDIAQAKDYAERADQSLARRQDGELDVGRATGGFKRTQDGTTSEYDGLIYVFSRQSEAEKALKIMTDVETINKVLGEHPGGIHVIYLHSDGTLRSLTKLPERSAP